jgi:hypothetical protein
MKIEWWRHFIHYLRKRTPNTFPSGKQTIEDSYMHEQVVCKLFHGIGVQ